ncbi:MULTISPECIES: PH domain-containing protein [unclassified Mycobacterium]|uniref:PH domain-containing protein n=1 Tax=unclassified Mycobacterium TaxID=2642494 RepID=UPI000993C8E5|nr:MULTISPECIES: PH domain-containing protein [unclassified Mycobacterium]
MTKSPGDREWELVLKPHLSPYFVYAAAFVIAAAHVAVGLLLKISPNSGVIFKTSDQVGIALVGFVIAGVVLMFARPRVRAGAAGIEVRNVLGPKLIPWPEVVGISFPAGAQWARLDLDDYEYEPMMAIQAVDKQRAVDAMDALRGLVVKYTDQSTA